MHYKIGIAGVFRTGAASDQCTCLQQSQFYQVQAVISSLNASAFQESIPKHMHETLMSLTQNVHNLLSNCIIGGTLKSKSAALVAGVPKGIRTIGTEGQAL